MSTSSLSAASGPKGLVCPKSLWRFCQPYLHASDRQGQNALSQYLGPVNDSEAFLTALASHEAKTPTNMMSDRQTTNSSRLAVPLVAGDPGILIEFNTTWRDEAGEFERTVLTNWAFYRKKEPEGAGDYEELRTPYGDLSNNLAYATGTRAFIARYPDKAWTAADKILGCLEKHPAYEETDDGVARTEGTVTWFGPEAVMLDFALPPSSSSRPSANLRWIFTKDGLSTYIPTPRGSSSTLNSGSGRSHSTRVSGSRGSSAAMSGSQRR